MTQSWVQGGSMKIGECINLADQIGGGRLAVQSQRIAPARVDRVHVRDGVNAIATQAGSPGFADVVDALIADRAAFEEGLLSQEAVCEAVPHLIRPPHRNGLSRPQRIADCTVQVNVGSRLDPMTEGVDVELGRQPANCVSFDDRLTRTCWFNRAHESCPGVSARGASDQFVRAE